MGLGVQTGLGACLKLCSGGVDEAELESRCAGFADSSSSLVCGPHCRKVASH